MPDTDLSQTIASAAANPKKIQGDEATIEEHSLPDLIAADQYLSRKEAKGKAGLGWTFRRAAPPNPSE